MPPPYRFHNVRVRSFALKANKDKLEDLCNRYLNFGRTYEQAMQEEGFAYRPSAPMVDLDVLTYPEMRTDYDYSKNPEFKNEGYMRQHELYFRLWVAKWVKIEETDLEFPEEWAMFIPYIFVDNPWSVISGREVVGYPKVIADFDGISDDSEQSPIIMKTDVFNKYGRDEVLSLEEAVRIEFPDGVEKSPFKFIWPWGNMPSVYDLTTELDDLLFSRLMGVLGGVSILTIQPKQFRDAEGPGTACYQSLVRGELIVQDADIEILKKATITIPPFASLRIAEDLGLESDPRDPANQYRSVNQYRQVCDQLKLGNFKNILVRGSQDALTSEKQSITI